MAGIMIGGPASETHDKRVKIDDYFVFQSSKIGEGSFGQVFRAKPKRQEQKGNSILNAEPEKKREKEDDSPSIEPKKKKRKKDGSANVETRIEVQFEDSGSSSDSTEEDIADRRERFPDPVYAIKRISMETRHARREFTWLRQLRHPNVIKLKASFLEHDTAYLVLEYAEFDLHSIIEHCWDCENNGLPDPRTPAMLKNIMHQLLKGMDYLHQNHIMHRDLKPANVLVMGDFPPSQRGRIKIADFGLSRSWDNIIEPLVSVDAVVVSLWYRSPELLLGVNNYSSCVDTWSIGCIFAELILLKPIFQGQGEDSTAFHYDQMKRIYRLLGKSPEWRKLESLPNFLLFAAEYGEDENKVDSQFLYDYIRRNLGCAFPKHLRLGHEERTMVADLIEELLNPDWKERITCEEALQHEYFQIFPIPPDDIFKGAAIPFPTREVFPVMPENAETDNALGTPVAEVVDALGTPVVEVVDPQPNSPIPPFGVVTVDDVQGQHQNAQDPQRSTTPVLPHNPIGDSGYHVNKHEVNPPGRTERASRLHGGTEGFRPHPIPALSAESVFRSHAMMGPSDNTTEALPLSAVNPVAVGAPVLPPTNASNERNHSDLGNQQGSSRTATNPRDQMPTAPKPEGEFVDAHYAADASLQQQPMDAMQCQMMSTQQIPQNMPTFHVHLPPTMQNQPSGMQAMQAQLHTGAMRYQPVMYPQPVQQQFPGFQTNNPAMMQSNPPGYMPSPIVQHEMPGFPANDPTMMQNLTPRQLPPFDQFPRGP